MRNLEIGLVKLIAACLDSFCCKPDLKRNYYFLCFNTSFFLFFLLGKLRPFFNILVNTSETVGQRMLVSTSGLANLTDSDS